MTDPSPEAVETALARTKRKSVKLTKRVVDALPTTRDDMFFDAELKGFGVRVKPSGSKTFLVKYAVAGQTRRVSIGSYGAVTAEEARIRARDILGRIARGEDPASDKRSEREAPTVAELCRQYLAACEKGEPLGKGGRPKKTGALYVDRGRIERHILPLLGDRKVRDVTTPDLNRFVRDVTAGKTATDVKTGLRGRAIVEGGKGTAARTMGLLGGILSFAVAEGIIAANPARGVRRPAYEPRQVRLSASAYAALGNALAQADQLPWQAVAAIKLIALTGLRRSECTDLRWEWVDLDGRCLRLADSKTGASVRPLGASAAALLEGLPRLAGSPFVFPGQRGEGPYGGLPKAWDRVTSLAGGALDGVTPHGLRHGFAAVADDLGCTLPTISGLLGHSAGSVTARYVSKVDSALVGAADLVSGRVAAMLCQSAGEVQEATVRIHALT
ncbi:site-specific integrase [Methylobacterium sp. J-088]|uniref:tyrosine-type recombinase/integrase n=1 Tax=Methylobacterium sp. J-088 TaxID=2836664 RepID=UPI001FB9DC5B|nr:site-specific integrase [Methylobacterium sp. J-088]MCJ2061888.1 site-specific integrase [Methylobacterium sp. J-088]